MFSILAKPFGYILQFMYGIIGNYGLSIVIFAVVIRTAMYPLYKSQIKSTQGMSEYAKKSKEIQDLYANDRDMMNQKLAELQRESGYNPAGGCLPMIVQLIVISGLFMLLRYPLTYYQDESMVFAVHEAFLWIKDLSQPDPWILPILAGGSTFLSFAFNKATAQQGGGASTAVMKYVFPVMFAWLAHSYPAGIAIYWFVSQFMQIFFNLRLNKIREEMQEAEEYRKAKEAHDKAKEKEKARKNKRK